MVSDSAHSGAWPYAGYVRQIRSSREDAGWRSLLVQRFAYAPVVADLRLPGTADVQLVLSEAGRTTMRVGAGDRQGNYDWAPGRLAMIHPGHESVASYHADEPLRSVQVHVPPRAQERAAEDLEIGRAHV
jgi:AraC family transcriptional regulator